MKTRAALIALSVFFLLAIVFIEQLDIRPNHVQKEYQKVEKAAKKAVPTTAVAPTIYGDSTDAANEFVSNFGVIASAEMRKFNIPASILLGRALIMSVAGTSKIAKQNNNYFRILCYSKGCAHGHCTEFSSEKHKAYFMKYKSAWESWRSHSLSLANGPLKLCGKGYREWADGLERVATSDDVENGTFIPAAKLIGVIEHYKLSRFDKQ